MAKAKAAKQAATIDWSKSDLKHGTRSGGDFTDPNVIRGPRMYADGLVKPRAVRVAIGSFVGFGGIHYTATLEQDDDEYLSWDIQDGKFFWWSPWKDPNEDTMKGCKVESARMDEEEDAERAAAALWLSFFDDGGHAFTDTGFDKDASIFANAAEDGIVVVFIDDDHYPDTFLGDWGGKTPKPGDGVFFEPVLRRYGRRRSALPCDPKDEKCLGTIVSVFEQKYSGGLAEGKPYRGTFARVKVTPKKRNALRKLVAAVA